MSEFVRRTNRPDKPIASRMAALDIELTERCNNDCIHCCINRPANDADARTREMTTAQIKDILREAADLGCLQVRFTGGEPLLRTDFEDIYVFARRAGLKVSLFTNGCLITARIAGLLACIPPLEPIEITVYGMHRESYEAVTRRPGSFAQFRRGVDLLLQHDVAFLLKSVILPPNEHETEELEAWARTIPWMKKPPLYSMFFDLRNRRDDANRNRLIESLRVSPQDGLARMTRDARSFRRGMAEFASRFMGSRDDRLFGCDVGECVCVDAYGRAQPCMGIRSPELTIKLTPRSSPETERSPASSTSTPNSGSAPAGLADALARFPRLRELRATNPEYLRRCARCVLKGLCEQCPAKSWAEHGELDTPVEYLCEVAHAQARYLDWLGVNELGWEVTDWQERLNHRQSSLGEQTSSASGGGQQQTCKEMTR